MTESLTHERSWRTDNSKDHRSSSSQSQERRAQNKFISDSGFLLEISRVRDELFKSGPGIFKRLVHNHYYFSLRQ